MLKNSFTFLPKVGRRTEQSIWSQKILTWSDFLLKEKVKGFSKEKKDRCDVILKQAGKALIEEDANFFLKFPLKEQWRLYDEFKEKVLFLDIETGSSNKELTVIGVFDGFEYGSFVKGVNLERDAFFKLLNRYKMLVTFNGAAFDIPTIERYFNRAIQMPHFDLKHAAAALELKGGLKEIELKLNLKRPSHLYGNPVELWRAFHASKDKEYLELLLEYNEEDVVNLKPLADLCFREIKKRLLTPFSS
ncbi:MAG: ribonuclease H-like domain-containing protein [Candidatus Nanoarchaeia archaeon]